MKYRKGEKCIVTGNDMAHTILKGTEVTVIETEGTNKTCFVMTPNGYKYYVKTYNLVPLDNRTKRIDRLKKEVGLLEMYLSNDLSQNCLKEYFGMGLSYIQAEKLRMYIQSQIEEE